MRSALLIPMLLAAACAGKDETVSGYIDREATFLLEELDGAPFPARATIAFPSEGAVRGEAPCNRWSARQTVPYPWIGIEDIASTRRTCPAQAQENAYLAALRQMTLVEGLGDVVILSNDAGRQMVIRAQK
ncbi:META domain-containing protein [Oceaniglobus roseus]|uniref:META domain-containing protein n=1 Tax=Oceaniglobus roseus TaxID=1737570 RepID=UPI000C7EFF75|nr:META domain-containing protein [Kandeliimicrobium roseum]